MPRHHLCAWLTLALLTLAAPPTWAQDPESDSLVRRRRAHIGRMAAGGVLIGLGGVSAAGGVRYGLATNARAARGAIDQETAWRDARRADILIFGGALGAGLGIALLVYEVRTSRPISLRAGPGHLELLARF